MLNEYFDPKPFSNQILEHYLSILLFELARSLPTLDTAPCDTFVDPYVSS